jgi:hypothetical protein
MVLPTAKQVFALLLQRFARQIGWNALFDREIW